MEMLEPTSVQLQVAGGVAAVEGTAVLVIHYGPGQRHSFAREMKFHFIGSFGRLGIDVLLPNSAAEVDGALLQQEARALSLAPREFRRSPDDLTPSIYLPLCTREELAAAEPAAWVLREEPTVLVSRGDGGAEPTGGAKGGSGIVGGLLREEAADAGQCVSAGAQEHPPPEDAGSVGGFEQPRRRLTAPGDAGQGGSKDRAGVQRANPHTSSGPDRQPGAGGAEQEGCRSSSAGHGRPKARSPFRRRSRSRSPRRRVSRSASPRPRSRGRRSPGGHRPGYDSRGAQ